MGGVDPDESEPKRRRLMFSPLLGGLMALLGFANVSGEGSGTLSVAEQLQVCQSRLTNVQQFESKLGTCESERGTLQTLFDTGVEQCEDRVFSVNKLLREAEH